jgi:ubiquinone/menaquinone biosynthesis C-methylase UbiE
MSNSYEAVRAHFSLQAEQGLWASFYESGRDRKPNSSAWPFVIRARRVIELLMSSGNSLAEVLDVGCGTAPIAESLVAMGSRYTGIDFSPQMIEAARQKIATLVSQGKAELATGDVRNLGFRDGAFDALTAMGVIEYLAEIDVPVVLSQFARILSPGGVAVITIPKRWHWGSLVALSLHHAKKTALTMVGKRKRRPQEDEGWERIYLTPGQLNRACEAAGLRLVSYKHYNMQVLCRPFTQLAPRFSYLVNRPLENLAVVPGCWSLASGYIGMYRKI